MRTLQTLQSLHINYTYILIYEYDYIEFLFFYSN
jgi:hypothetical protein